MLSDYSGHKNEFSGTFMLVKSVIFLISDLCDMRSKYALEICVPCCTGLFAVNPQ